MPNRARFFQRKCTLREGEAFAELIRYQDLYEPGISEDVRIAACAQAISDGNFDDVSLRQIYGDVIVRTAMTQAKTLKLHDAEREHRADLILSQAEVAAEASLVRPHQYRSSLLGPFVDMLEDRFGLWLRAALPALIFFSFLFFDGDLEKPTFEQLYNAVAVSIFSGWLFFTGYYYVLHRIIRWLTYQLFGSPVYDAAREAMKHSAIDPTKSAVEIQDVVARFFKHYRLRSRGGFFRNSLFHWVYMSLIIFAGTYFLTEARTHGVTTSFFVGLSFVGGIALAMKVDELYGEIEETKLISSNASLFVAYLKKLVQHVGQRMG
jgi:hypothetical protein